MKIYIFAFSKNISEYVIENLEIKNSNKFYLKGILQIKKFVARIKKDKPDLILGVGEYSKSSKYILIEKYCTNNFKQKIYGDKFEKIKIPNFINENKKYKFSNTIGTSYCNLVSFLITKLIYENKLKTKYTFLHLSKNLRGF